MPLGFGDQVLDAVAGPGMLTLLAARRGASVIGIDNSARMIARLNERLGAGGGSPAADALYHCLGPEARPVVRRELERQLRERHGDGRFQLAAEAHIAIGLRH